jgi:ribosomal protein L11 methyltransferase
VAWQQLTLRIPAGALERTEALLRLAGAAAVAISDGADTPILEPEPGSMPLWSDLTVRALFNGELDLASLDDVLGPQIGAAIEIERLDDDELARAAEAAVEPLSFGPRLTILPAERMHERDDALGLHMGLAFGTGRHPTTRLCLEWLEQAELTDMSILDHGCGNGVLALAALKLGARSALGIDTEPQALAAAERNAGLNGLAASIRLAPPENADSGPFDLILANILARPLLELAGDFAERQRPGARILLSGILVSQIEEIEAHYRQWYESFESRVSGDWALLIGQRRNGYDR